ncbi:MAG: hypothetical protein H6812_04935 [Phycisphaeraceae bacterium]|nr:hypothetical protein [Phycisphaerales bacterium]MCB9842584.1 hypothetical protein [Phycisphaeraceae bacterium]
MKYLTLLVCSALAQGASARQSIAATPSISWNLQAQVEPWLEKLYEGKQARIAFIGDSISFRNDTWIWFFRDLLDNRFDNAGEGYLACSGGFRSSLSYNGPRNGLDIHEIDQSPLNHGELDGDVYWATTNGPRDPVRGALAPDGMYAVVSNTGQLQLDVYGSTVTVFYIAGPDAGTLRVRVGGHIQASLDARAESPTLRTHVIELPAPNNDTMQSLTFESVTGEPIQINGVLMQGPDAGSQELRVSRGGAGPADFLVSTTQPVADQLAILAPDLAIVMIDWEYSYYQPSNPLNNERFWFQRDTERLLDFYQAAMPDTKFILATHHPFNPYIAEEADVLYRIAVDRDLGFLNLYTTWPSQSAMAQAGLLIDTIHLTPIGGDWFARYFYDNLFAHTCGPDANNDGSIDVDDLNVILSNWGQGPGWRRGDVNFDRRVDVDDLNEVLAAWNCSPD